MKTHNFYIKILEFGKDHLEGFNYSEIKEGLKEKLERELQKEEIVILEKYLYRANSNESKLIDNVYRETIFVSLRNDSKLKFDDDDLKYIINFEAFSKYLDYLDLKGTREFSNQSLKYAENSLQKTKTAILISLGALIVLILVSAISIYFSAIQIKNSNRIEENQFNQESGIKE
jgi:hypothetical protein